MTAFVISAPAAFPVPDFAGAHRIDIQLRFSDTDQMGHINNAAYAQFLEVARLALMASLKLSDLQVVLARLELDFRREVRLGQQVYIETIVTHLGQSSWGYASRILADDLVAAESRSVQVLLGSDKKPTPLPQPVRAALASYLPARLQDAP